MTQKTSSKKRILGTVSVIALAAFIGAGALYVGAKSKIAQPKPSDNTLLLPEGDSRKVALVLYQNGRAFIEDTRRISLPNGQTNISFGKMPDTMIVSSATVSGPLLSMQTQNFNPITEDKTYYARVQDNAIGQKVQLLWSVWKDGKLSEVKKEATLLAVEKGKPVLLIDGLVHFGTDAQILYPNNPSGAEKKDKTLSFTVNTQTTEPQDMTLSYLATGFSWQTNYAVYLDERQNTLDIKGFVTLNNNGKVDYKNAHIDFVLGDIDTVYQPQPEPRKPFLCEVDQHAGVKVASDKITVNGREEGPALIAYADEQIALDVEPDIQPRLFAQAKSAARGVRVAQNAVMEGASFLDAADMALTAPSAGAPTADIRQLKDYYVYRLPFTVNLLADQPVQALFMQQTGLTYHKEYTFQNPIILNWIGERKNMAPKIHLLFANKKDGAEMPLPQGLYRIFNRQNGQAFFVGEEQTYQTTGRGAEINLTLGDAVDVLANVQSTDYQKDVETLKPVALSDFESQTGYLMTYRNLSDEAKTLLVHQDINERNGYQLVESALTPSLQTPEAVEWRFELAPGETKGLKIVIKYTDLEKLNRYREAELAKEKLAAEEARLTAEKERMRLQLGREGAALQPAQTGRH